MPSHRVVAGARRCHSLFANMHVLLPPVSVPGFPKDHLPAGLCHGTELAPGRLPMLPSVPGCH